MTGVVSPQAKVSGCLDPGGSRVDAPAEGGGGVDLVDLSRQAVTPVMDRAYILE